MALAARFGEPGPPNNPHHERDLRPSRKEGDGWRRDSSTSTADGSSTRKPGLADRLCSSIRAFWDRRTWDDQFHVFAEQFRAIRYDVRGYGKSSKPEREYSKIEDLRALLEQLGVDRTALIGSSMGGGIAIDFAVEHPQLVWALVPVAAALSGVEETDEEREKWAPVFGRIMEAANAGEIDRAVDLLMEIWAPLGTGDRSGQRIRQIALENSWAITNEGSLAREIDPPALPRLSTIRAATLIVLGAQDLQDINQMWSQYGPRFPASRTVVLEGADHVVNMRQPEEFNRLVLEFLGSVGDRST
jgi:pimeloyl-ACP methyl ester carboxylesterase